MSTVVKLQHLRIHDGKSSKVRVSLLCKERVSNNKSHSFHRILSRATFQYRQSNSIQKANHEVFFIWMENLVDRLLESFYLKRFCLQPFGRRNSKRDNKVC